MSPTTLYLISIVPAIRDFVFGMFIIAASTLMVVTIIKSINTVMGMNDKEEQRAQEGFSAWVKSLKLYIPVVFLFGLVASFIPTEKQLYMIAGGYTVTNIDGVSKLPDNIIGAANAYLEKITKGAAE